MELLKSSLLTCPHGFPTRSGGVSRAPFDSLNTALTVGDEPAAVEVNLARVAEAAGVAPARVRMLSQVHGDRVVEQGSTPSPAIIEADGHWTETPGLALGIRTADCLPVLLEDPVGRRVAAVHAGWRGVIAEIAVRAVEALAARGSRPGDLRVVLGPAIQRCCFEVDGDLPARFAAAFGDDVVVPQPEKSKPHLDLARAVVRSLGRAGVPSGQIEALSACTHCDTRFFSHRREHGRTGRHLSFITCRFATPL